MYVAIFASLRYHSLLGLSNNICRCLRLSYMGFKITRDDLMNSLANWRHEVIHGYTPAPAMRTRTWNINLFAIAEVIEFADPLHWLSPSAPMHTPTFAPAGT
ncbi:hypothetical protein BDZ45DRAFT_755229 [Acephala macrosclerotiorum]|nr:hypothetical protein BDZ45DRAFT_755229 [Acephala macrosclerotiorum]